MRVEHAVALIAPGFTGTEVTSVWADLGCGCGTFTLALAHLLADRSTIHAMDTDASALHALPRTYEGVTVESWRHDFLAQPWPFDDLDGVLMANSLHYVQDQLAFVRQVRSRMKARHRFLIVEYDLASPNPWVPHPVGRTALQSLFSQAEYSAVTMLGARRSTCHRGDLFAAMVTSPDTPTP